MSYKFVRKKGYQPIFFLSFFLYELNISYKLVCHKLKIRHWQKKPKWWEVENCGFEPASHHVICRAPFYHPSFALYYETTLTSIYVCLYIFWVLGSNVWFYFIFADEMYVLSTSNKKVSIELLGTSEINDKLSRFEELTNASLAYMGVSSPGIPCELSTTVPSKLNSITLPFLCL
jgi:hypothetical protein